jgi:hypothetical protein
MLEDNAMTKNTIIKSKEKLIRLFFIPSILLLPDVKNLLLFSTIQPSLGGPYKCVKKRFFSLRPV